MSIDFVMSNNSAPHINIISGSTSSINEIISTIKKFKFNLDNTTELFGLGVLLTPEPLIYMRFSNSIFMRELRFSLVTQTLPLWDSLSQSVTDDFWLPKCTLAYKDFSTKNISEALSCLEDINFKYKMKIKELSVIDFTISEIEITRISI